MTHIIRQVPDWLIPVIILILSIVAAAIIIDRARLLWFRIRAISVDEEHQLLDHIRERELQRAADYAAERTHPAFAVVRTLIESSRRGLNLISAADAEAQRMNGHLKRFLQTLGTISTIAPLLGLLGTVTGMIKSFHAFDAERVQNAQLVGGIDEALITTALGLIVAIPALIAYNYFANRVNQIAAETAAFTEQVAEELERQNITAEASVSGAERAKV